MVDDTKALALIRAVAARGREACVWAAAGEEGEAEADVTTVDTPAIDSVGAGMGTWEVGACSCNDDSESNVRAGDGASACTGVRPARNGHAAGGERSL